METANQKPSPTYRCILAPPQYTAAAASEAEPPTPTPHPHQQTIPVTLQDEFARFPFPLSPFQKHSIEAIVHGSSVLVTAHTGSGKTVPAEFAIQYFVERGKKAVYCSPIKALSNQKYYEFQQKYPEISFGLLTGDNKINTCAHCLIMTTEILMNHLHNNVKEEDPVPPTATPSPPYDLQLHTDELAVVILDEVHYINDKHRGHVWERVIMSLPQHIQLVLLSATIDQPVEFATWVAKQTQRDIVLCSTSHRIVPLGHYSFVTTTELAFKKIKDKAIEQDIKRVVNRLVPLQTAKGQFQEAAYHDAARIKGYLTKYNVDMKRKYVVNKLLQHLTEENLTPALLFLFSRKQVEQVAAEITVNLLEFDSKVPYIARREVEQLLRGKLPNFAEYMALPQYEFIVSLLEKGIGIHHAGMVPIFREIVELFISKKYIKLLIATESFAIGLDCPIKSTLFIGFTKWDGDENRLIMPHEYTQMAGRAGRRGIDTIGYVIHCNNLFRLPAIVDYKHLLCGKPERFASKFDVTCEIILNCVVVAATTKATKRDMVQYAEKSMAANEMCKRMEAQRRRVEEACRAVQEFPVTDISESVKEYIEKRELVSQVSHKRRKELEKEMNDMILQFPRLMENVKKWEESEKRKREAAQEAAILEKMEAHLMNEVSAICRILQEMG